MRHQLKTNAHGVARVLQSASALRRAHGLETVQPIPNAYRLQMEFLEWIITILLVYIGLLVVDTPSFEVLRPLRLLQAFRVFKLGWDWPHGSQFSASLSTTLWRIEP